MRRLAALLLIVAGVSLLAVLGGRLLLDGARTAQAQDRLLDDVPAGPAATSTDPVPTAQSVGVGEALVEMRIPRFGDDWRWAVSEGTAPEVLEDGPGHYPATALPGQRGNAAVAAHRAGFGNPFIDFDLLRPGDEVILGQGETRWVYQVETSPRIVPVDATWVLRPTPGRQLTLTTCWPRYGSSERMFVRARLVRS